MLNFKVLLEDLDTVCIKYDEFDYGIPYHDEQSILEMIVIIKKHLFENEEFDKSKLGVLENRILSLENILKKYQYDYNECIGCGCSPTEKHLPDCDVENILYK